MSPSRPLPEAATEGLWILDPARRTVFANAALALMLGYPRAELGGRLFDEFLQQNGDGQASSLMDCLVDARGSRHRHAVELVRRDGDLLRVEIMVEALAASDNEAGGTILHLSHSWQSGPSGDRRSQLLEFALDAGGLGAWGLDLASRKVWRTFSHDQIFGYDAPVASWRYRQFIEHVIEEDRNRVDQTMSQAIDRGAPCNFECRIRRLDGEIRWIWVQGQHEFGVQGKALALFGVIKDITEHRAAEDRINFLAFYDPLTALPNRQLLMDRLGHAMTVSARSEHFGALLFIDLDDFKTLNDSLGHDAGDRMLVQTAARLSECLRDEDTVARFGGDEFVVLLERLGRVQGRAVARVQAIAQKILSAIGQPYAMGLLEHRISTCSIGAAMFSAEGDKLEDLLRRADLAMYRVKANGGNGIQFFQPDMQEAIETRLRLEAEMKAALGTTEFSVHYQPQIDRGGATVGAEALVRWRHPERGAISPLDFIPTAEECGLIMPIGRMVLAAACSQLKLWAGSPETVDLTISVNVSARQFHHPDFVDEVLAVIYENGADARKLRLELTESMLIESIDDTSEKMSRLKAHGVRFSLDDFGTGYSSLYYLKRLPLDQLKIDQRFVADVLVDPNDAAIVRSIISMAEGLGLNVIAEGVESVDTRGFLIRHNCDLQQGFLYSEALPGEQFAAFVRTPHDWQYGDGHSAHTLN